MLPPIGSTLESMIGLMSSQYPHTHGVRHMFPSKSDVDRVNLEAPKLPKILKESGYETAVIGDWCSAIFNEVPMGFENIQVSEFDSFRIWLSQAVYLSHPVIPMYFDNKFGYWLFPKLESFAHYLRAEVVTDRAIDKIKKERTNPNHSFIQFSQAAIILPTMHLTRIMKNGPTQSIRDLINIRFILIQTNSFPAPLGIKIFTHTTSKRNNTLLIFTMDA